MAQVNYKSSSPYASTPQSSTSLGYWVPPSIARSITDTLVVLTPRYNNRPDLLSYDMYGTPRLWWTFAMLNPDQIQDPIYDMVAGKSIYVASNTSIQGYL